MIVAKDPFWPDQIEVQRLSAAGWIAFAEDNKEEALSLIQKAADLEDSTEKHPVTPDRSSRRVSSLEICCWN